MGVISGLKIGAIVGGSIGLLSLLVLMSDEWESAQWTFSVLLGLLLWIAILGIPGAIGGGVTSVVARKAVNKWREGDKKAIKIAVGVAGGIFGVALLVALFALAVWADWISIGCRLD
jgi:uncharacterized membrane protein